MNHDKEGAREGQHAADDALQVRAQELAEEAASLHKETSRLLVQRRKIQARIKSLFKSILLQEPRLTESHGEVIEHELSAADENALHFEVWFPEFKQITELLIEENRRLVERLTETARQAAEAMLERDRARELVDTLETGRLLMAGRLEAQSLEINTLRNRCAELEHRACELEAKLAEASQESEPVAAVAGSETSTTAEKQLTEAEARYHELARMYEKDRLENAREIASLTKQLTKLRERYESQLAQLAAQNEELTQALASRGRTSQGAAGAAFGASDRGHAKDAMAGPSFTEPSRVEGGTRYGAEATVDLDAPIDAGFSSAGAEAASAERPRTLPTPDQIVILDDEPVGHDAASQLIEKGFPVTAFSPHPDLAAQLPVSSLACTVLNLASPDAWTTLRAILRSGEAQTAWVAYVASQPAHTVYWFGEVGFLIAPFETLVLTRSLRRLASRLRQGIVISPDNAMGNELSLQLSRARVTGAVARDRAQTLEVIKAIYPHIALAHLGSSPVDVFRAVAALRNVSLFSHVPIVFVLDEAPHFREASLYSAAARTILRLGKTDAGTVVAKLAGIFGEKLHIPRRSAQAS